MNDLTKLNIRLPKEDKYPSVLLICAIVVIIGLLTHGYAFFDAALTHDSLNALRADIAEIKWKISLGRVCMPVYQALIRGEFTVPWLAGCLALLWMGIAVYLVTRMFQIKSWISAGLIAGVMITNLTVILTAATYIHDLDTNMLALMFAVLAAYQWNKHSRFILPSAFCICISLGLYQAYVSVCIVLMLMRCMMDILQEKPLKEILFRGIKACVALFLGAVVYAVMLKFIQHITGVAMDTGTGNGLQNMAALISGKSVTAFVNSYTLMYEQLVDAMGSIFPSWLLNVMHLSLGMGLLVCTWELVRCMQPGSRGKILFLIPLVLLVPPAVFFSSILSGGASLHLLMLYALWLVYLLVLVVVDQVSLIKNNRIVKLSRVVVIGVVAILIWGNIRTANAIYLIKDMQSEAANALMTRVVYRMEESEEYVTGVTPVAFIGQSNLISSIAGTARYANLVGMYFNLVPRDPVASYDSIYKLVANRLGNPLVICNGETYLQLVRNQEVAQMPCYPEEGSMRLINGVFVVKLGN